MDDPVEAGFATLLIIFFLKRNVAKLTQRSNSRPIDNSRLIYFDQVEKRVSPLFDDFGCSSVHILISDNIYLLIFNSATTRTDLLITIFHNYDASERNGRRSMCCSTNK